MMHSGYDSECQIIVFEMIVQLRQSIQFYVKTLKSCSVAYVQNIVLFFFCDEDVCKGTRLL